MRGREPTDEGKVPFLSLVAHEFRNPLSPAMGYVRMLLKGTFGPVDEKQRQVLDQVHKSLSRLNELTNELSELSLLEGGGSTFTTEPVDLAQILDEAIAAMPHDEAERNIRLTYLRHTAAAQVQGNRQQLRSALGTLLFAVRNELGWASEMTVSLRAAQPGSDTAFQVAIAESDLVNSLENASADDLPAFDPYRTGGMGFRLLRACHILFERQHARLLTLRPVDPASTKPPPGILLLFPPS